MTGQTTGLAGVVIERAAALMKLLNTLTDMDKKMTAVRDVADSVVDTDYKGYLDSGFDMYYGYAYAMLPVYAARDEVREAAIALADFVGGDAHRIEIYAGTPPYLATPSKTPTNPALRERIDALVKGGFKVHYTIDNNVPLLSLFLLDGDVKVIITVTFDTDNDP